MTKRRVIYLRVVEAAQLEQRVQVHIGEVADGLEAHALHRLHLVGAQVHARLERQSFSARRRVGHEVALQHGQRAVGRHVELARRVVVVREGLARPVRVLRVVGKVLAPEVRRVVEPPRPHVVQKGAVIVPSVQVEFAHVQVRGGLCGERERKVNESEQELGLQFQPKEG